MTFAKGHNRAPPPKEPEPKAPADLKLGDPGFLNALNLAEGKDLDALAEKLGIKRECQVSSSETLGLVELDSSLRRRALGEIWNQDKQAQAQIANALGKS
ncbi:MAG TPA: hypothetical protein VLV83_24105 [Acidobacteriota bacterium]|nr:hypothetical protein [Acidobacteriota bacterium]